MKFFNPTTEFIALVINLKDSTITEGVESTALSNQVMNLGEAAQVMIVGMLVVFTILLLLSILMVLLRRFDLRFVAPRLAADSRPQKPVIQPGGTIEMDGEEERNEELVAVITAAISQYLYQSKRVYSIRYVQPRVRIDTPWDVQARTESMPNYYD
jgi:sodium pump decarboxylase gamma subunit